MNNQQYQRNNNFQGGFNNRGNQQQPNNVTQERKPFYITNDPLPFDGELKSKMTTTVELAKTINSLFRSVLADYEGSIILPNMYGQLELVLYFKDKGGISAEGQIKSLQNANNPLRNGTAFDRISAMNTRNKAKNYDLTPETKEILSEFIFVRQNQKIDWNRHISEQTQQNYNSYTVFVKVIGLDLIRVIRKLYGSKDPETKSRIDYTVSLIRPVGVSMQGFGNQNFLINISQLNNNEIEKLANEIGLIPAQGQFAIIR